MRVSGYVLCSLARDTHLPKDEPSDSFLRPHGQRPNQAGGSINNAGLFGGAAGVRLFWSLPAIPGNADRIGLIASPGVPCDGHRDADLLRWVVSADLHHVCGLARHGRHSPGVASGSTLEVCSEHPPGLGSHKPHGLRNHRGMAISRLFAGQTAVFVQSKTRGAVVEASLAPVSANTSQTGYFILGGLTAIALCVLLLHSAGSTRSAAASSCGAVCIRAWGWSILSARMQERETCWARSKPPITLITEAVEAGFVRITGPFSEASSFASASLACLAFCYTYWRKTKSRLAQWLAGILLFLTILSTSSDRLRQSGSPVPSGRLLDVGFSPQGAG